MQALMVASLVGGGISAYGSYKEGQAAKAGAKIEAAAFTATSERASNAAKATSQQQAKEQRRQAGLLQSKAIARIAASGGLTTDKTTSDIISGIEGEGEYRALMNLYEGKSSAYELENRAKDFRVKSRYSGRQAARAGTTRAVGTAFSTAAGGYSTFGSKYGNSFN